MIRLVAILFHRRHTRAFEIPYVAWWLKEAWERRGIDVEVVYGLRPVHADVLFPQIDLTVRPRAYDRFLARFPRVINAAVRDISKRRISSHGTDGWNGPVIVKTDRNHSGWTEQHLMTRWEKRFERLRRGFRRSATLKPYLVFPSLGEVPAQLRRDRSIFIDRFVPEREGERYVIRTCSFLGDRHVTLRRVGEDPLVRTKTLVHEDEIETDERVLALARTLRFDYGRFDYVLHDGEVVLFDANQTPAFGVAQVGRPLEEQPAMLRRIIEILDDGIEAIAATGVRAG